MIKSCEGSIGYSRKIVSLQEDYLQIEKFAKDIKKKSLLDAFKSGQIFYDLKPKAKKTTKKKEDDEGYEKYARSHMINDLDGFRLSYRTYEGCAVTPEYDEVEEYLSKHTAHPAASLIGRAITELKQMRRA